VAAVRQTVHSKESLACHGPRCLLPKRERLVRLGFDVPETLKQEVGELQLHEFLREVQRDFDERTLRGLGSQEMYRTPFTKLHTLGVEPETSRKGNC
jgi:hypothetical protein